MTRVIFRFRMPRGRTLFQEREDLDHTRAFPGFTNTTSPLVEVMRKIFFVRGIADGLSLTHIKTWPFTFPRVIGFLLICERVPHFFVSGVVVFVSCFDGHLCLQACPCASSRPATNERLAKNNSICNSRRKTSWAGPGREKAAQSGFDLRYRPVGHHGRIVIIARIDGREESCRLKVQATPPAEVSLRSSPARCGQRAVSGS
jgi:hypothetical protein